ncbi:MAG: hypothetical protein R3D85_16850 [Paracoccaceae bacterium]
MVNPDGTVSLSEGNPDIGGSRASMSMMAAEELGVPPRSGALHHRRHRQPRSERRHRRLPRHLRRGLATIKAARHAVEIMKTRAAMKWGIDPEAVEWRDGAAHPAGPNAGNSRR